ncbi:hypothetical protein ACFE04_007555 [Oxalis oulophora]
MNNHFTTHSANTWGHASSNGNHIDQIQSIQGVFDDDVVEWLNHMLPSLNLPLDAPEDELIACLMDGTVLCSLLTKIDPSSNAMVAKTHSGQERVRRFLEAMDEMGLPSFDLSDLNQGNLMPILHCLKTLEAHFNFDDDGESIQNHASSFSKANLLKRNAQARGNDSINGQLDQSDVKVSELLNSNSIDNSSTQSLFGLVDGILEESIGKKNGEQHVALLLRKAVRVIEHRFSTQAENLKKQNNFYKAREEKYQSRLKTLETLAMGTIGENEVVMNVLHQIKIDKSKLEEKEKLEEQDVIRLKKEKDLRDEEILMLKLELDSTKKTHKNQWLDLEAQAEKTKVDLNRKIKELECILRESRAKVKELESFSESKYRRWKKKEYVYQGFIEYQTGALQDMKEAFESIKYDLLKTKRSYADEFNYLGVKLKSVVDAAENYQVVLAENRKLYNQVQDLKEEISFVLKFHVVLTVHVRGTELKTGAILRGNLHLVDLAGSERVDRSEVTGDRLREAQHINKSLSALGDVIFALAQKSQHVPYRNSKLTQVLQSSLGGQAKTLMFVQLNPDAESYSETVSTLKFAERVSGVELGAARSNKEGRDVRGLMEQVASLKATIAKNEDEIERLHHKLQINTLKHSSSSQSLIQNESASPRRHSIGTPRLGRKLSRGGEFSGRSDKAASDIDNCSEYSDKNSEVGSQQSLDDIRHHRISHSQLKLVDQNMGQNVVNEDTELLRFGEADSDERLSDISDGDLSMGTETDGSINSLVEFTLFPEAVAKQVEKAEKQVEKPENTGKLNVPTKIPKPPIRAVVQTKHPRLSLNKSSSAKVPSSARKTVGGSASATKPSLRGGRWA